MTTMVNSQAAQFAWKWPLRLDSFRRHERLSKNESDALQTLGFDPLRLDRDREHPQWQAIERLTAPLDEAVAALDWHPDTVFQRPHLGGNAQQLVDGLGEGGAGLVGRNVEETDR